MHSAPPAHSKAQSQQANPHMLTWRWASDAPVGSNTSTVSSCCPSRSSLTCSVMSTLNLSYLQCKGEMLVLSRSRMPVLQRVCWQPDDKASGETG